MSKGAIVLTVLGVATVGVVAVLVLKGKADANRPPAYAGPAGLPAGLSPNGVSTPRTGSAVTNTINDILGFADKAVNIWGDYGKAAKANA